MNKKDNIIVTVVIVTGILLISGCVNKEENKIENYIDICKNNIVKEYDLKIIELKSETLKLSRVDEIIENETKKELENFTKEYLIKNAKEYDLNDEDIEYFKNLSDDEFEKWKEEYIGSKIRKDVSMAVKEAIEEVVNEYNYSIIKIKDKDEIRDIVVYLKSFGIDDETIEKAKKKFEKGKYVVIIELNTGEKLIVPEFCDEKGKIIQES